MGMTYREMAAALKVPFCDGGCGLVDSAHQRGVFFIGVLHWRERRFTRRGAKNFLSLIAYDRRLHDPEFLNIPEFDWLYLYNDAVVTQGLAMSFGFRIPARLFAEEREKCRRLAFKRGVKLSTYPSVYEWARAGHA
jgi:hypothetical protein